MLYFFEKAEKNRRSVGSATQTSVRQRKPPFASDGWGSALRPPQVVTHTQIA